MRITLCWLVGIAHLVQAFGITAVRPLANRQTHSHFKSLKHSNPLNIPIPYPSCLMGLIWYLRMDCRVAVTMVRWGLGDGTMSGIPYGNTAGYEGER